MQDLSVLRDSGHEHLTGSLVIPLTDADGIVTDPYDRKIERALRAGALEHLCLKAHRGAFNADILAASEEVILCEALIDVLTFW